MLFPQRLRHGRVAIHARAGIAWKGRRRPRKGHRDSRLRAVNAVKALHPHLPDQAIATLRQMAVNHRPWMRASAIYCLKVLDDEGKLVGTALIRSEFGQPHELFLRVAPAGQGQWERPLLAKLMRRLRYLRRRHIKMVHPAADEWTQALLMEAGFQNRRTLTTMKLQL